MHAIEPMPAQGHPAQRLQALEDRAAIADALYRFAAGQDQKDPALFASAFAADARLDFTQPARRLGAATPTPIQGRDLIVRTIMDTIVHLDTTHTVTNLRVELQGERAALRALIEAQHLVHGRHEQRLLLKNLYRATAVRDGTKWRLGRVVIENVWYEGDATVLLPAAARAAAEV